MGNTFLSGAQWGDEGKGKIIDVLAEEHDWVVRYQGGANAGHTVEIGDNKYILHLLPSGILRAEKKCIIGNGVVIDPIQLVDEIEGIQNNGISVSPERLFISGRAHLILDYHKEMDGTKNSKKIGTTKRGIGPAYETKAARIGIRAIDLKRLNEKDLTDAVLKIVDRTKRIADSSGPEISDVISRLNKAREFLEGYIVEDTLPLYEEADGSLLAEGAQGTMLDLDHGTYPFVTSSSVGVGGFYTGTGAGFIDFERKIGILKAYTTRVGEGPFPTELFDENGKHLSEKGHEFGATTGRPRRCGWLDLAIANYSARINGYTEWCITKLDVLSGLDTIKVCTHYENGMPADLYEAMPILHDWEGWNKDLSNAKVIADLDTPALSYLENIEDKTGIPIRNVSIGPRRSQTIGYRID
ncbi:adenylosuccinate synthase [Candidatus Woesearchaeota archaeon]|nr:adenylosuccinate synthase [Candidatus Woesearchaeota archaeon]